MSQGQGPVSYQTPQTGSGGGGTVTGANNGVSLNGTDVVLGNDLGDATQPAKLLTRREIPMNDLSLQFTQESPGTTYLSLDASEPAFLNYFKGAEGQEPWEIITIQGADPGSNPYGNFWGTLDESFTNPDGQIDAVLQWGYNQTGTGGARVTGEAAIWWSMESHFIGSGGPQFEIELQSVAKNGDINRHFQFDINKETGQSTAQCTFDSFALYATNTGLVGPYFSVNNIGEMVVTGSATSFNLANTNAAWGQMDIVSNNDGSVNISNATTGGNPIFDWINNFVWSAWSGATGAVNMLMSASTGAIAMEVTGSTTAPAAYVTEAIVDCSGPLLILLNNSGTGDAALGLVAQPGGGNMYVIYSIAAGQGWVTGILQSTANYVIAAGDSIAAGNVITVTPGSQTGVGGETSPTAFLHVGPSTGAAGKGPLKLTNGTLLTSPEDGLFEYDGTHLYFTIGATRNILV